MSKAFSNKALPAGTVLREWRLEEVLGVGGFGIVYKARGIYFDELVAIKEYFPSSISDRNAEDTVVPIDSDAEEVHALGLKKFVEEAKLLWNLSTPTRHPNIVSVRSLFEIHGTAYIVMDFEDGISLSKMLRQGRRFNERSLWGILRPIAEGLDRAHRVGVLHRDIKPPNILINEDNRPVLIDFGSARFTTAEATSTTVTFHTPPYAAIEQYVRTYDQGPWTDIYALGVVMFECVTGEKPAEVLERLHAGLGSPLAAGKWPGYGKRFLTAIDAAMTIKPDERPQSIMEWLAMFGKPLETDEESEDGADESTHFYSQQVTAEEIVPVATAPGGFEKTTVETDVPTDPKQAQFKRLGEDTNKTHKRGASGEASEAGKAAEGKKGASGKAAAGAAAGATDKVASKSGNQSSAEKPARKMSPVLIGAAAVGLLVIGGSTVFLLRGGGPQTGTAVASSQNGADGAAAQPVTDSTLAPNPVLDAAQNTAAPAGTEQAAVPSDADSQLRKESAKAAAAEAQLAQLKRAADKAAKLQAAKSAAIPVPGKPDAKTAAATSAASSSSGGGVSPAKVAQLNAIVDEGRAMAKQVMRSGNSQNAQLARNYDSYLKTAKDSMRGVSSDKEADRLIKQASQTRAYIQFLVKQSR